MNPYFKLHRNNKCDTTIGHCIFYISASSSKDSKGSKKINLLQKVSLNSSKNYKNKERKITTPYKINSLNKELLKQKHHNGCVISFLDEMPELPRSVLEVLRQPLEDRKISISRAKYSVEYPCSFMLVASMNPCPCGYYGDPTHNCVCTPGQIQRYMNKISGPLLDRIDIHCEIQAVPFSELSQMQPGEPSATIRERVIAARKIQEERFKPFKGIHCNAMMSEKMLHEFAEPDAASMDMLRMAMERLKLSARAYSRILKVARTIADLAGSEKVESMHIAEAIGYRNLDRGDWAERGI